jgi:hypothetical protein
MTSLGSNPGWKRATNSLWNGTTLCYRCETFKSRHCFLPYLSNWLFTIHTIFSIIYVFGCYNFRFIRTQTIVKLYLYLSTTPWTHIGCIGTPPTIIDLDIRWRWVVIFTPRLLYPLGKTLRYPLDRRLNGTRGRFGRRGIEKFILPTPGIEHRPSTP